MVFISIERYLVIRDPFNSFKKNKLIVWVCITLTWIYSILWLASIYLTENGFVLEGLLISCTFDYLNRDLLSKVLMNSMVFGGFIVPLLIVAIFYTLLYFSIKSQNQFFKSNHKYDQQYNNKYDNTISINPLEETQTFTSQSSKNSVSFEFTSLSKFKNSLNGMALSNKKRETNEFKRKKILYHLLIKREAKVAKRIFYIIISFCVAWLPYTIVVLIAQFGNNIHFYLTPYTATFPALFAKSSAVYNPVVYVLANRDCMKYFLRKFRSKRNKNNSNNCEYI